jgi:aldehyde:ferredoxin oxidoreductase
MAETYGYTGKILRVNLTTGDVSESSSDKYLPKYIGSKGLLTRLYWDEIGTDVKPFDPENKLIFANGPLNGTGAIGSAKGSVGGKSPVWYPVS